VDNPKGAGGVLGLYPNTPYRPVSRTGGSVR
jgi:hypothetical protein